MKFTEPIFKNPPQCVWANVPENIDNWIQKGNQKMLDTFCIKTEAIGNHKGYRFINSYDLTETITVPEKFKGIAFEVIYSRYYKTRGSFDPLWFSFCHDRISYKINGENEKHPFISKASLIRHLNTLIAK